MAESEKKLTFVNLKNHSYRACLSIRRPEAVLELRNETVYSALSAPSSLSGDQKGFLLK